MYMFHLYNSTNVKKMFQEIYYYEIRLISKFKKINSAQCTSRNVINR